MSGKEEYFRKLPRVDLYDSYDLVHQHMPLEQPPSEANYIIFPKGGMYFVKNCESGSIEFQAADLKPAFDFAMASLTLGRTWKECIMIKGDCIVNDTLRVGSYTTLVINGRLRLADGVNKPVIMNSDPVKGDTGIEIVGGFIDANRLNQTAMSQGILLEKVHRFIVRGVYIRSARDEGINPFISNVGLIEGCYIVDCGLHGIGLDNCYDVEIVNNHCIENIRCGISLYNNSYSNAVIGNVCRLNKGHGISLEWGTDGACYFNTIRGNLLRANVEDGIYIFKSYFNTIGGNVIQGNKRHGISAWSNDPKVYTHRNIFSENIIKDNEKYGLLTSDYSDYQIIVDNFFLDNVLGNVSTVGANNIIRNNGGWMTEQSGIAILTVPFAAAGIERIYVPYSFPIPFVATPKVQASLISPGDISLISVGAVTATGCVFAFSDNAGVDKTTSLTATVHWRGEV